MPEEIEVPTEHLHEKMEEAAHEAHGGGGGHGGGGASHASWISRVAVSSALLAVAAAISALLAGHHANEAILEEMIATDQWQLYQAKSIKASVTEGGNDLIRFEGKDPTDTDRDPAEPQPSEALKAKKIKIWQERQERVKRYNTEMAEIREKAEHLEHSSEDHMGRHVWIARAVTAFQIAIAIGAIAVLARRPRLWWISLALGGAGSVLFVLGLI
jgi:hypothetical protein